MPPSPPALPAVSLRVERELGGGPPFLSLRRVELTLRVDGGTASTPFAYDAVERRALDAAVVAAHYTDRGETFVLLRSAVRPPLALRAHEPVLWELPAGLIEPGEAPRGAAARELLEETGVALDETALSPLGPPTYPAPAMVAEQQYFFHAVVRPEQLAAVPAGDGSPLEAAATMAFVRLADALSWARDGALADAKTELALRRLAELASAPSHARQGGEAGA